MAAMVNIAMSEILQFEVARHMMMKAPSRDSAMPWNASMITLSCDVRARQEGASGVRRVRSRARDSGERFVSRGAFPVTCPTRGTAPSLTIMNAIATREGARENRFFVANSSNEIHVALRTSLILALPPQPAPVTDLQVEPLESYGVVHERAAHDSISALVLVRLGQGLPLLEEILPAIIQVDP